MCVSPWEQLRDPVDRVLSAYEFAVEVAARVLNRPKDYKPDPTKVNTRDVWPWSQLVPFIEEDMVKRVRGIRALLFLYPVHLSMCACQNPHSLTIAWKKHVTAI